VSFSEYLEQIDIEIIKNELFFNGYVMVNNKQREKVFYWECEKRSNKKEKNDFNYCNARIVTNWSSILFTPTDCIWQSNTKIKISKSNTKCY